MSLEDMYVQFELVALPFGNPPQQIRLPPTDFWVNPASGRIRRQRMHCVEGFPILVCAWIGSAEESPPVRGAFPVTLVRQVGPEAGNTPNFQTYEIGPNEYLTYLRNETPALVTCVSANGKDKREGSLTMKETMHTVLWECCKVETRRHHRTLQGHPWVEPRLSPLMAELYRTVVPLATHDVTLAHVSSRQPAPPVSSIRSSDTPHLETPVWTHQPRRMPTAQIHRPISRTTAKPTLNEPSEV